MKQFWSLTADGIRWDARPKEAHQDHLEMSGRKISAIVQYGCDAAANLILHYSLVFPALRLSPNDTHASCRWECECAHIFDPRGGPIPEILKAAEFNGILHIETESADGALLIRRRVFPSTQLAAFCEIIEIEALSNWEGPLEVSAGDRPSFGRGVKGVYEFSTFKSLPPDGFSPLKKGGRRQAAFFFSGRGITEAPVRPEPAAEYRARKELIRAVCDEKMVLETPEPGLNMAFRLAKLRAAESIFDCECGLLHSPGGGRYYAAVWTNDQMEYAAPFFGMLGYGPARAATENAMALFARFMGPQFTPIPSSIIAEGRDFWEGAGDRGDAAMYLYGAARYLLAAGDREVMRLWLPALQWCREYCWGRRSAEGVILSDSDELEGRFPSGQANLCTSCLFYDGLRSLAGIYESLDDPAQAAACRAQANALRAALGAYFGAKVSGYPTYRYYAGNHTLRAWIAAPLTVGIYDRAGPTAQALLSPRLWTENGLLSEEGGTTFWDRATLYALRGLFCAGETEQAHIHLAAYVRKRLLGEHVPYPVEACPEGAQRHLSAESALLCRVFTEGILGIRPSGCNRFELCAHLPAAWSAVSLRNIVLSGKKCDFKLAKTENGTELTLCFGQQKIEKKLIGGNTELSLGPV